MAISVRHYVNASTGRVRIQPPTGLRPVAQGCRTRLPWALLTEGAPQPQRGCGMPWVKNPRHAPEAQKAHVVAQLVFGQFSPRRGGRHSPVVERSGTPGTEPSEAAPRMGRGTEIHKSVLLESGVPAGTRRFNLLFRWFRFASPPANVRCASDADLWAPAQTLRLRNGLVAANGRAAPLR